MQPTLSEEQAVQLHMALTDLVCKNLHQFGMCDIELWAASEQQHIFFQNLSQNYSVSIFQQEGENLGSRMANAVISGLKKYQSVILVGADCPFVDGNYLNRTLKALEKNNDVVVGPAQDGGYVLLGLKRYDSSLFDGIEWGSDTVLQETIARLKQLEWSFQLLGEQMDIDRPRDLLSLDDDRFPESLRQYSKLYV